MSNIATLDLSTVRPSSRIWRKRGELVLPAATFTVVDPPINVGSIYVFGQYNYTAPEKFTIVDAPYVNYHEGRADLFCPIIKYRIGATVTRYKLWNPSAANYELYDGQVIYPNFSIEIWSILDASTSITIPEFRWLTSITTWPTGWQLRDQANYSVADGADAGSLVTLSPTLDVGPIDGTMQVDITTGLKFSAAAVWLDNTP